LVAAPQVNDRKAAHAKRRWPAADVTLIVRAAVLQRVAHARHGLTPFLIRFVLAYQTSDATHTEIRKSFAGSLPVEATGKGAISSCCQQQIVSGAPALAFSKP
jgi:hypothetical protein